MPAGLDHLLPHLLSFGLVVARMSGLFIFGPLLSSVVIPMRLKAIFILAMSAAVYPVAPSAPPSIDLSVLAPAMAVEVGIGLVIGILAAVPLMALEMSGVLVGQQMGFGLAKVFNPEIDFDTDLIGQLLFYIAAGAFLAAGGIETLFASVVETFHRVPLGGFDVAHAPLQSLLGLVASGFELAWRVAAPVTATILLMVVALGIIGKTMPQINIMTVGFTAKILAGLAMLAASIYAAQGAVWDHVSASLQSVLQWAAGPR